MNKGFTIPELLVVAAIMTLMSTLVLTNWRSGERSLALERAAHKAGQDVRKAQELALRAQSWACGSGSIYAYGIYFDSTAPASYLVFAECDSASIGYNAGADGIVETVQVESGVEIASVLPGPQASVVFIPPVPRIFIKPGDPLQAQVVLRRIDGQGSKTLTITSKGVIDID